MTDIDNLAHKFGELIKDAQKILITSHISPDPDAVCSLLLLGTTLKSNFPYKEIKMSLEEPPNNLDYLTGFSDIGIQPTMEAIASFEPALFVLLDGVNFDRASRNDGPAIRDWLVAHPDTKTAIIDHHETIDKDDVDVFLNQDSPATCQDVYELCFRTLDLKKPDAYAQTALLGIYSDTGGLVYLKDPYDKTLSIVSELLSAGGNLEEIRYKLNSYTEDQMKVFAELANNCSHESTFTYSYLTDDFVKNWQNSGKSPVEMHRGTKIFVDDFIRNIDGRKWGFIAYLDPLEGEHMYSVSLRSADGVVDVAAIARKFNGGGHKPAAGGRIEAENISQAIDKIKTAIKEESA